MVKGYRFIIALFLVCVLSLQASDSDSQQQVDSEATAAAVVHNTALTNQKAYSYTDYALLGGAGYLMFIYSCFIARDALIAIGLGLNFMDLDRFSRFLTYSAENVFKLCIIGGLTYKTIAAHAQQEGSDQEIGMRQG